MNMRDERNTTICRRVGVSACVVAWMLLVLAACSPGGDRVPVEALSSAPALATAATPDTDDAQRCTDEPRTDESDQRLRCGGMAAVSTSRAHRVAGGGGDPVDQIVCDIEATFVLDGKLFGVEFSGGMDGTYTFVRTPNIPGLSWTAGGRYHIEFPDGADKPGTMTTEGGGTTTAGTTARATTGGERFTLTPVEACTQ